MSKAGAYIKDINAEMKHVTWPTRVQSVNYTLLVISISVFVAIFFYIFDEIFIKLLQTFVLQF